ncbi:thioredoxin family protein [Sulfurimonas sp. HSL-1716]|uniref:thioredoxin family protein n=1 Tax=Hydrocurvibacter sulfurireducens TaxID=3131937 RepID=UPI0031F87E3F
MKRVLMFISIALSLYANDASKAAKELGYVNSFDKGIAKAQKEHKLMMLVLVKNGCSWCKKLERETLSDSFVKDKINNFVRVLLDRNDKMPDYYRTPIVPVVYFVDPKTKSSVFETAGFREPNEFLDDIQTAEDDYNALKK